MSTTFSIKKSLHPISVAGCWLCGVLLLLNYSTVFAATNFQTSNTTVENTMFRLATEYNDPSAQYLVGRNYLNGNSVKVNVPEAIKWFEMAAKQNHIRALYQLGVIYLYGEGVRPNYELAGEYLKKSALKNHLESQYELGKYYLISNPSHPNYEKALEWLRKAADRDHIRAIYEVGKLTYEGHGVTADPVTGIRLLTQAANSGYQDAIKYLSNVDKKQAITVQTGQDIAKQSTNGSSVNGKTLAFSDSDTSSTSENYRLGLSYLTGDGNKKDPRKAAEYFEKAANSNHPNAQYQLAKLYQQGIGVQQNEIMYVKWLNKASDAGVQSARRDLEAYELGKKLDRASNKSDPASDYSMAMQYYNGSGLTKDPVKASKLLLKAADQNYSQAQYQLGVMYQKGVVFDQDDLKARQWYQKAADNGMSDAKLALTKLSTNGDTRDHNNNHNDDHDGNDGHAALPLIPAGKKDNSLNSRLLDKNSAPINSFLTNAKNGDHNAQYEVALRYLDGNDGYEQSVPQAIKWLEEAAKNNNIDASAKLGMLYFRGHDVDKNYQSAAKWLEIAAEHGDAESQYLLGDLFKEGLGVEKNSETAVMWFRKAANQGHKEARKLLGGCRIC